MAAELEALKAQIQQTSGPPKESSKTSLAIKENNEQNRNGDNEHDNEQSKKTGKS